MKITIEIDLATLGTVVTGATPAEARSGPMMVVDEASSVLDAGVCSGLPGERTTSAAPSHQTQGEAASAGMAPAHRDSFGLRLNARPGSNGLSGGSPLGGTRN